MYGHLYRNERLKEINKAITFQGLSQLSDILKALSLRHEPTNEEIIEAEYEEIE